MKNIYSSITKIIAVNTLLFAMVGCDDFLDVTPPSTISPEKYLWEESHLAAYTIKYYTNLDSYTGNPADSPYWSDICTDNAVGRNGDNKFMPGQIKVGSTGGSWSFTDIRPLNFYLETVVPRYEKGELKGDPANVKHYIGEGYFLRAYEYFKKLKALGDFPIITATLPDDLKTLIEVSKRRPRNEVARFILSDLDKAIDMMKNTAPQGGRTRLNKNAALIMKSRVALFEGTWLKHHKGTAHVPLGPNWPGSQKEYLKDYQYPSGSIDAEIDFFLEEAMEAAQQVADKITLTANNKTIRESASQAVNPYYDLFASKNPAAYPEAVMFRTYSIDLATPVKHGYNGGVYYGYSVGYTQQFADVFLMENGLPYYATGSNYKGDDYIADTKVNRDWRWRLFMKAPGEVRVLENMLVEHDEFPSPAEIYSKDYTKSTTTGYLLGKGQSHDFNMVANDITAFVVFRAVEAYLNYMEACYEKTGRIDAKAEKYWKDIRRRAGVDVNYQNTIDHTNMDIEAQNDWGAYSHGVLVDKTLYNIRRERRCEFIGEGRRYEDLIRWRALDQLNQNPCLLKGCKVWGPMQSLYTSKQLLHDQAADSKNIMSSPSLSDYLIPLSVTKTNNLFFDGLRYCSAHYLDPIARKHFLLTSPDSQTAENSVIYQNPGWSLEAGEGPLDL